MGLLADADDIEVVGEAADGAEAVAQARLLHPDVVLLDLRMPVLDGVAATGQIVAAGLGRVLVLTTYESDEQILAAIGAGAAGYLLKAVPATEILAGVRAVAEERVGPVALRGGAAGAPRAYGPRRGPGCVLLIPASSTCSGWSRRGLTNAEIGRAL